MTITEPRAALRSFLGVPLEPQTYRALAYNLLAFPLGVLYFAVLVTGAALTVGLGFTLAGPLVLAVTLLAVAALAWADARLTGGLLGADISPAFPDGDALEFLERLFVGRLTWGGTVYLLWRSVLGLATFVLLVAGFTMSANLLVAPLGYGEHLAVHYGGGAIPIDTPGRALAAAGIGALLGLLTLHASNLLGVANVAVAGTLLDPDGTARDR